MNVRFVFKIITINFKERKALFRLLSFLNKMKTIFPQAKIWPVKGEAYLLSLRYTVTLKVDVIDKNCGYFWIQKPKVSHRSMTAKLLFPYVSSNLYISAFKAKIVYGLLLFTVQSFQSAFA